MGIKINEEMDKQFLKRMFKTIIERGEKFEGEYNQEAQLADDWDPMLGLVEKPNGDIHFTLQLKGKIKKPEPTGIRTPHPLEPQKDFWKDN